jgi:hypothetical protein
VWTGGQRFISIPGESTLIVEAKGLA